MTSYLRHPVSCTLRLTPRVDSRVESTLAHTVTVMSQPRKIDARSLPTRRCMAACGCFGFRVMISTGNCSTLSPSQALGGERREGGLRERMPLTRIFILTKQIREMAKSHEHVGRFALKSILSSTFPESCYPKHTHCGRLQRKNQSPAVKISHLRR